MVAAACAGLCTSRCVVSAAQSGADSAMISIQLSTSVNDVEHDFGLIRNQVNPFEKDQAYQAPPSAEWSTGAMNLGMYRSLQTPGQCPGLCSLRFTSTH